MENDPVRVSILFTPLPPPAAAKIGIAPGPCEVKTCPDVPGLPLRSSGLAVPLRLISDPACIAPENVATPVAAATVNLGVVPKHAPNVEGEAELDEQVPATPLQQL